MIAIEVERSQIRFLSDVFVVVASGYLKLPVGEVQTGSAQQLSLSSLQLLPIPTALSTIRKCKTEQTKEAHQIHKE